MANIIQHPGRFKGAMGNTGGALLAALDGLLAALEQGLFVVAPDVTPEQAAEMYREIRVARFALDDAKEAAGISGYFGSFHLCREDETGGAA
jgi:DNA-binding IclR family transcriptional regulator